ncbi:hypothetical protein [Mycobacterium botniense]|uniref:Uncharacterized protein n=1 Tax=Mycobacterium botniense TaxID=84962 RepID=A0A7I9XVY8_9MYCO|nr:hypothetical protein [Mycobacterium botniense]GFG73936.1 hypothetical protein MBOT_13010 [Mycobacterium botniense]
MTGQTCDDPVAQVDALVAAIGPRLSFPAIRRRDVVLVTGPWLAGVSSVVAALRDRLPQYAFVESNDLAAGDAPTAVVFVVSAAAPLTASDCALLDVAAADTDVVIGVVSKIDVHRKWRDVLAGDRELLAAHAPRYHRVRWVGVAAAPELGEPHLDDLVAALEEQLGDPDVARRNRLRAWESRLNTVARRYHRDAEGAGRRARVQALREQRSTIVRQRRMAKTERTIALRSQIQQARVQLSYFARSRCSSVRGELQEDITGLTRRKLPEFEAYARERIEQVLTEVDEGATAHLTDVAQALAVTADPPSAERPRLEIPRPPLRSRRLETRLMMLLGAGFGLGVALTLSRLVTHLAPGLTLAGTAACVVIGLAVTVWVVGTRGLLHDRAVLDRWVGDAIASLRSAVEQLVATRVLAAESVLSTALGEQDELDNAKVTRQVSMIDTELREHAIAGARAAALRDREMPTLQAALEAVRAELGDVGAPKTDEAVSKSGDAVPRCETDLLLGTQHNENDRVPIDEGRW